MYNETGVSVSDVKGKLRKLIKHRSNAIHSCLKAFIPFLSSHCVHKAKKEIIRHTECEYVELDECYKWATFN